MDDSPTQLIYLHQLICSSNLGDSSKSLSLMNNEPMRLLLFMSSACGNKPMEGVTAALLNLTFSDKLVYTIHIRNTMVN